MVRKKSNTNPEKKEVKFVPRRPSKYTCEQIAKALEECNGQIYLTAEKLDVNAHTVYRYLKKWPVLRRVRKKAWGITLDKIEAVLIKRALAGDLKAILRVLAAFRERWKTERTVKVKGNIDLNHTHKLDTSLPELTDDIKNNILEEVKRKRQESKQQMQALDMLECGLKELPADQLIIHDLIDNQVIIDNQDVERTTDHYDEKSIEAVIDNSSNDEGERNVHNEIIDSTECSGTVDEGSNRETQDRGVEGCTDSGSQDGNCIS